MGWSTPQVMTLLVQVAVVGLSAVGLYLALQVRIDHVRDQTAELLGEVRALAQSHADSQRRITDLEKVVFAQHVTHRIE